MENLRIAAFGGFRSIPPRAGAAGSDKIALELYPRIVARGHSLIAYSRIYPGDTDALHYEYEGVKIKYFKTVKKAGFDTLVHSAKATFDVIFRNTADVVHIHSGANSIWAMFLRLAGKRVVITQFAMDWKRDKWPWYGKLFYLGSNYLTSYCPNAVAFDNVFTKEYFEKKFNKKFDFIPYGSEVKMPPDNIDILDKLSIAKGEYFLFVGRFIPDKGLHILVEAFSSLQTIKKLVIIGGSPNPGKYELSVKGTKDSRIIFPGYVYGDDTNILMKNAYAYIQPSLIEGLSPVILTVMGLGTPLICSDIMENKFICGDNATTFISGKSNSLTQKIEYSLNNPLAIAHKAAAGQIDIKNRFNWDKITDQYIELLKK
ncbi:glycosyltransferase family 4 protein [Ferruginibacter sp.]|uniref:glycosyltransferase family 4 protein n=1 Tax=Ferruginibacter sp. TaxID=1940288 RepID=UPI00265B09AD|nr:glycosyltransferase family 4 protein [Ferruginibacter sp.]